MTPRTRARVLLAEDDIEFRGALAESLRLDGFEVVEVPTGEGVCSYLDGHVLQDRLGRRIDAVITDLRMPAVSGLMVLEHISSLGYTLPTIVITAFDDPQTRREAKDLGATAVLPKPFDIDDLERLIDRVAPPRA